MKRKLVSLCLIFTFLFSVFSGGQLELSKTNSYALVKVKLKNKGENKSVWKNHTKDEYFTYLEEIGWRTKNPEYESSKYLLIHKDRLFSYLDCIMGVDCTGEKIKSLINIRTHLYKDDVAFRNTLEKTLSYFIPDGAKEITDFAYKHHRKYNGKSYAFYNVNGTTVVLRDINGKTAISIFSEPYMKLKEMQELASFIE